MVPVYLAMSVLWTILGILVLIKGPDRLSYAVLLIAFVTSLVVQYVGGLNG